MRGGGATLLSTNARIMKEQNFKPILQNQFKKHRLHISDFTT
jgi:23S rRNA G2069 N7-methylase RlmK/C1962 C5-methylase RlmI